MTLIVQKYGGSSLANAELIKNVARRVAATSDAGNSVVAVVSAMGNATDQLLDMANQMSSKPEPRELDVLLSTGELRSCALLAMALNSSGHSAISLSGGQAGIQTDTSHGMARIAGLELDRITMELSEGNIVVVAGFQGITDGLDITTLGRGASDLTAIALAAGLGASSCEVYTDVDGIYTADPKIVPMARKLDKISFEEMLELASYGAKMNPRSIELGMVYDTPILVASSFHDTPGTLIHGRADVNRQIGEIRNRVSGIATDTNVAKITVLGVKDRPGIAATLFEPLAKEGVSVDVIVQNAGEEGATDMTFTVQRTELETANGVVSEVAKGLGGRGVATASNLAKLSIVGTGMQDAPGYASRMFRTLADENINIEMITTSEIRITCLVSEDQIAQGARALHKAFGLDRSS